MHIGNACVSASCISVMLINCNIAIDRYYERKPFLSVGIYQYNNFTPTVFTILIKYTFIKLNWFNYFIHIYLYTIERCENITCKTIILAAQNYQYSSMVFFSIDTLRKIFNYMIKSGVY